MAKLEPTPSLVAPHNPSGPDTPAQPSPPPGAQPSLAPAQLLRTQQALRAARAQLARGQAVEALGALLKAVREAPSHAPLWACAAEAAQASGQAELAEKMLARALALVPQDAPACSLRAKLAMARKDWLKAAEDFGQAAKLEPQVADHAYNEGLAWHQAERLPEAVSCYQRALALDPNHPESLNNLANAQASEHQRNLALATYDRLLALQPNNANALYNRGSLLSDMGLLSRAVTDLQRVVRAQPSHLQANFNLANTLMRLNRQTEAVQAYNRVEQLQPGLAMLPGMRLHARLQMCDWRGLDQERERLRQKMGCGEPVLAPFVALHAFDDPALQSRAAEVYSQHKHPQMAPPLPAWPRRRKIRVGYFSPDFRQHPVSRLMAEVFESHDRSRFDWFAFHFAPFKDDMTERVQRAIPHFFDVGQVEDARVAEMARSLQIDIAVDLAGFTTASRPGIFAQRAAPVQMAYLGYLGSMGGRFMDYLVADPVLIDASTRAAYPERVLSLPFYQANDAQRPRHSASGQRRQHGLPEQGLVFCCLNNAYKFNPEVFAAWMALLKRVPDSVLLLLADTADTRKHLRQAAAAHGIKAQRLLFAERLPYEDYLARYALVDLFLDSWPYNAGTTASDALWMGTPVLTCKGQTFASRMAASLLSALGLPELIAQDPADYLARAVALAETPERLGALRQRLLGLRDQADLFSATAFARHLEAGFEAVHERAQAGLAPQDLQV